MADPTGITGYVTPSTGTNNTSSIYTGSTKAVSKSDTLSDKDTFLKLLVAQLKYQDPSNPADSTQFLAQTAQFTQVEKLADIAQSITSMVSATQMQQASNLVGKTISYKDASGAELSGVVTSATLGGSNSTLKVGNTDVPLSSVTEVRQSSAS
jgi:flagellar basal-body rod modification protein FlgD